MLETVTSTSLSDAEIIEKGKEYCSYGDKVFAQPTPKVFRDCDGSFMFDSEDVPYLDLQMWFASCNLGYKNKRISEKLEASWV